MKYRLLMLVLTMLAGQVTRADAGDDRTFRNTDVFELEYAADPQISPDGGRIAYVRRSMDIMTDRAVSNIWIVDVDGSDHRPLFSGHRNYSQPRWSPDGNRLAYVSAVEGHGAQIHVRWMDTGQTAVLSHVRSGPSALAWSPDGRQIAFSMFVKSSGEPLAKAPGKPEGAKWAPPVKVIERMYYRADGEGFLPEGFSHLFVIDAEGGTPRQLTRGDFDHGGPLSWSADGARLYFSANRKSDWPHDPTESEIWTVALSDGKLTMLTDRDGPDRAPVVSPDGSMLAYLGYDDRKRGYENSQVYLMDLKSGAVKNLTGSLDRSIGDVRWAGSNSRMLIGYDDEGRRHIATLNLKGGIRSLVDNAGGTSLGRPYTSGGFSVAGNGAFAYTLGGADRPADVGTGKVGRKPRQLTDLNGDLLAHRDLASVEEITWRSSADGLRIQGWIVKPPGFDETKQYPMILEIHGGPFAAYGPHFSVENQRYAARGYVVLYANPRGSTSYGSDFANEIHHNYPGQDYDDLMSGVDAMLARGYIDRERLYVTGGSGGGVLTAWIVGKTDRFRAAVVAKPVIEWTTFSLVSDGSPYFPMYWFAAMPWEDHEAYWRRSPLSLVGNVTTPTALLTGELDYRTPIGQSEVFYQALKIRKVDTALIRIPEASHGITRRPSQMIAKTDNILAWFARYGGIAAEDQK